MDGGQVGPALGSVRAGLDALRRADLTLLDAVSVAQLLVDLERIRRELDAIDLRVLREAEARWVAGDYGQTSTAELLMHALLLSPGEARARVDRAADLGPNRAVTGEPLPPLYPHTAAAFAAGEISVEHTEVIRRAMADIERIPDLDAGADEIAEKLLVEAAHSDLPRVVAQLGAQLRDRLDPDGPEPREAEIERKRNFTLHRNRDGSFTPKGRLTAGVGGAWQAMLDPLSAPLPADDGTPDDRSAEQRRHDAFGECAARLLRSGTLPHAGGSPVTVVVRVNWRDYLSACVAFQDCQDLLDDTRSPTGLTASGPALRTWLPTGPPSDLAAEGADIAVGPDDPGVDGSRAAAPALADAASEAQRARGGTSYGVTDRGGLLALSRLMLETCEAQLATIVTNDTGGVLAFGTTKRLASPAQRLALAARDGGCCFPGCTRPAAWCESHHVLPWQMGGRTDLANLCLLCRFHHREFERRGWKVTMADGHPEWIPPPWLDPAQRPRRNTAHHPPELDFAR